MWRVGMVSRCTDVPADPPPAVPSALATTIYARILPLTNGLANNTTRYPSLRFNALGYALTFDYAPMRLAPSTIAPHVLEHRQLLVPLLFLASATFVYAQVPVQHSLFVTSTSWLAVCMPTIAKVGIVSNTTNSRRSLCWLAGAFLSLSCICDRAALDKQGVWATKVRCP